MSVQIHNKKPPKQRPKPQRFPDRAISQGVKGIAGKYGLCQYIHGEPACENTYYCGLPTLGSRSWCETHSKLFFTKLKEKKDE